AAKALHAAGYRVVVFDDLGAGHRPAVRYGELVEGDVCDVAAVREALRRHDVFAVLHFAAYLDVGESVREPARYYRNNVVGALSVLDAMAAESVGKFVFSSTCAIYGEPIETPIVETHPQRPINSYGETKLAVERALPHFERAHGTRSVALRYFNAAGADPDAEIRRSCTRRRRRRSMSCAGRRGSRTSSRSSRRRGPGARGIRMGMAADDAPNRSTWYCTGWTAMRRLPRILYSLWAPQATEPG